MHKRKSESFKKKIGESEEFIQLVSLLRSAILLSENPGLNGTLQSVAHLDFNRKLRNTVDNLNSLELDEVEKIWIWFAPKGLWDDLMGISGSDLGAAIFDSTERLRSKIR